MLLPGVCSSLAGRNFQQPIHHWRLSSCNRRAVHKIPSFQSLAVIHAADLSAFWKAKQADYSKNHRNIPYRWH
jgi:hypothetical protein